MLANLTSSNPSIVPELTVPGADHLLDFRAEPEGEEQFLSATPLQDLNLNDEKVKHYDAMNFKRNVDMLLPDDYYKSFQQVVEENGFKFEQHEVETEDGYLLTVFRVMNADVAAGKKQPVVFMQHGLMDTADTWIMNFAEKAPGFMIAKAGYDVWFGNNRGNSYSNKHKTLDPVKDEEKFHDYGFRELGLYDMPAQIDMVLEKTGAKTVTYFGHSQGTSQMFYALWKDEAKVMSKINLFVACAPVARMNDVTFDIKLHSFNLPVFEAALGALGIHHLWDDDMRTQLNDFGHTPFAQVVGFNDLVLFLISNLESTAYSSKERVAVIRNRFPNACSTKELFQYGQIVGAKKFQEYDYGFFTNLRKYGSAWAPEIKLDKIQKMPIAMFVGGDDHLATPGDAIWEREQLGNVVHFEVMSDFDHESFMLGFDTSYITRALRLVEKYNPAEPAVTDEKVSETLY